jgi:hypothetical protein
MIGAEAGMVLVVGACLGARAAVLASSLGPELVKFL